MERTELCETRRLRRQERKAKPMKIREEFAKKVLETKKKKRMELNEGRTY